MLVFKGAGVFVGLTLGLTLVGCGTGAGSGAATGDLPAEQTASEAAPGTVGSLSCPEFTSGVVSEILMGSEGAATAEEALTVGLESDYPDLNASAFSATSRSGESVIFSLDTDGGRVATATAESIGKGGTWYLTSAFACATGPKDGDN